MVAIRPQRGPQTTFATCPADVAFFATMPGSGKSWSLCMEALRWSDRPNYTGVLMRYMYKDLMRGPTSLFGTLSTVGRQVGGRPRQAPIPSVEFPRTPSSVLCLHGHTEKNTFDGIEIAMLGLDEAQHFELPMVQYIMGSRMRTTCGIRPYVRASCMPTADCWVRDLVTPWLIVNGEHEAYADYEQSGRVRWYYYDERGVPQIFDSEQDARDAAGPDITPQSIAFVFARTQDNLALMAADPGYVARMSMLPAHERSRLMGGNWNARPSSAGMFDRAKWRVLDQPPHPKSIVHSVRGWDLAATRPSEENEDPDWTRGARLDLLADGTVVVSDMVSMRDRPGPVDDLIRATARQDGHRVIQAFARDPGSAGVRDEEHIRSLLRAVTQCGPVRVQPAANKVALAREWSALLHADRMAYVRASWSGPFLSELDKFPSSRREDHDDQVDAVSYAFRELPGVGRPQASARTLLAHI